jgi:hypothetical protein
MKICQLNYHENNNYTNAKPHIENQVARLFLIVSGVKTNRESQNLLLYKYNSVAQPYVKRL